MYRVHVITESGKTYCRDRDYKTKRGAERELYDRTLDLDDPPYLDDEQIVDGFIEDLDN